MVSATTMSFSLSATGRSPGGLVPLPRVVGALARLLAVLGLGELFADSVGEVISMAIPFSDLRGPRLAKRPNEVEDGDELDDEEEDEEDDDLDDDEDDFEDDEEFEEEFGEDELEDDDDDIFYDDDDDE